MNSPFRTPFAESIFNHKYRHEGCETWEQLSDVLVEDVCRNQMSRGDKEHLKILISEMKFIPGGRYLYYCSAPETMILCSDYTWKSAKDISIGESLIGFDEGIKKSRFKNTTVTGVQVLVRPRYRITTDLGSIVVSNCHQFVWKPVREVKKVSQAYQWRAAKDLVPGGFISFASHPWKVDTSYEAGWLSGILDGEGTVSKGSISVSQKPGPVLDRIVEILSEKGIRFYVGGRDTDAVKTVHIRGRWESCKVLGMFRPIRLMNNWIQKGLGAFWSRIDPPAEIISVEYLEEGEVIAIETTEKTLITNGFLSHNCGRPFKAFNNCFLLKCEEDSRQDWANLSWKAESCLMTGGGIGSDYSIYRPKNSIIKRTGGLASGPVSKIKMINEIGREVQQGGSRRSAIYASLNWKHGDVREFIHSKDWYNIKVAGTDFSIGDLKEKDFNFPAPMDMTNISVNYDTEWIESFKNTGEVGDVFLENIKQALSTAEPGLSFNFYNKENETLRNACCEVSSEDDSDVCNLGSVNLSRIETIEEFKTVVELATKFLICGTLVADLPYEKVYKVREKNRRLGLGLMGIHEWLLKRGYRYEVVPELHNWLSVYRDSSDNSAKKFAGELSISEPVARRAIAPVGSIGILAGTTTAIEPLFAVAMKRRYLKGRSQWVYQYVIDGTAKIMISQFGVDPEKIETALDLASDYERRIKFQADVQDYVDMSISSTINLPAWGSDLNNEDEIVPFAKTLASYAERLRGFTCYPDGARGGQPLTSVPYKEAISLEGQEFEESFFDICDISRGGTCGS